MRWKEVAMIFQAAMNAMNPVHRVGDQMIEALMTHEPEMEEQEAVAKVKEMFDLVGLDQKRMWDYPHQYSGGMKQRAIIAMALICEPRLIVADEPTTALDVIVQDQILKEIKSLQKELNLSIIFISHDISIVAEVCDNIGVMYAGQTGGDRHHGRGVFFGQAPLHQGPFGLVPHPKRRQEKAGPHPRGAAQPHRHHSRLPLLRPLPHAGVGLPAGPAGLDRDKPHAPCFVRPHRPGN